MMDWINNKSPTFSDRLEPWLADIKANGPDRAFDADRTLVAEAVALRSHVSAASYDQWRREQGLAPLPLWCHQTTWPVARRRLQAENHETHAPLRAACVFAGVAR